MKLPATMKMSATAKLSSNYILSPDDTHHTFHAHGRAFFFFCCILCFEAWRGITIAYDQIRYAEKAHTVKTLAAAEDTMSQWWWWWGGGKKSAVCNRMSGLSCLIPGATWDWMQRRPHPCANSLCVCLIFAEKCKGVSGNDLFNILPFPPPAHPSVPPAFSCDAGEFLEMSAQECTQCAAGSYSLGSGVRFDQWDSMPAGFSSLATSLENSPRGDDRLTCNRCESWMWRKQKQ